MKGGKGRKEEVIGGAYCRPRTSE